MRSSFVTPRWREPDSNPRSHPTALVVAHIRPIIVPTPRRSSAAALADGLVPLESDRRHCRIRLHRSRTLVISFPFCPKRPASTCRTRSSNPLSSSGESANPRSLAMPVLRRGGSQLRRVNLRCRKRLVVLVGAAAGWRSRRSSRPSTAVPNRHPAPRHAEGYGAEAFCPFNASVGVSCRFRCAAARAHSGPRQAELNVRSSC
jgi:hypothetical protein